MGTKILLTGTFDAGKTTLGNFLKRVPGIHVIPEYARELLAQNRELWRKPDFQEIVLAEQLRREAAAAQRVDPLIVCDRGTIDVACFSQFFGYPYDSENLLSAGRYDVIFLLSPDDIVADQLPSHMKQARWELEELIKLMLKGAGLPYCVLKGTPSARVGLLLNRLAERPELAGIVGAARTLLGRSTEPTPTGDSGNQ